MRHTTRAHHQSPSAFGCPACPECGHYPAVLRTNHAFLDAISPRWRWLTSCTANLHDGRNSADAGGAGAMTLPREVIPRRFYMVTRRCTQRQLLLRPDDETNNAFLYCLAEAAQRFGVEVLLTC